MPAVLRVIWNQSRLQARLSRFLELLQKTIHSTVPTHKRLFREARLPGTCRSDPGVALAQDRGHSPHREPGTRPQPHRGLRIAVAAPTRGSGTAAVAPDRSRSPHRRGSGMTAAAASGGRSRAQPHRGGSGTAAAAASGVRRSPYRGFRDGGRRPRVAGAARIGGSGGSPPPGVNDGTTPVPLWHRGTKVEWS
jgi:hypothetical protein